MVFRGKNRGRQWLFRSLLTAVLVAVIALVADFVFGILSRRLPVHTDLSYYQNIVGDDKVVALTFDDGPDPVKTPKIMEILKRNGVPATFFFMGSHALKYPEIVRQAHEQGFEIGNHTFTHSHSVHTSRSRLSIELNLTNKIIEGITGEPTELYRPPFLLDIGSDATTDPETPQAATEWASENGYIVVGADVDSKDWTATSADEVYTNVMNNIEKGHLVLLHDSDVEHYTVNSLERIIVELKQRGYRFTTSSNVLGLDAARNIRITGELRRGMTDAQTDGSVTSLQTFLRKEGDYQNEVVGVFGPITQKALTDWQARNGIENERGFVGFVTRKIIEEQLATSWPSRPKPATFLVHPLFREQLPRFSIFSFSAFGNTLITLVRIALILVGARLLLLLLLRLATDLVKRKNRHAWRGGVSVLIPVFNEERNVRATVESVLRNDYPLMEVIAIDDGSTDSSGRILKKLQAQHPDIVRVIQTSNGGKARALNLALNEARYGVLVTMDGDTIFSPTTVQRLVRFFSDPAVGAVAGRVKVIHPRRLLNFFQHIEYTVSQNIDKTAMSVFRRIGVVPGPVGAWRRSDVLAAGGFRVDTLVEDQDLTLALLERNRHVLYEPRAVAYTETPYTIRDFTKQRFRWIFGTLQCLWKYKKNLFNPRKPVLGWILLPDTIVNSFLLTLLYPMIDLALILSFVFGYWRETIPLSLLFVTLDMLYAGFAFWYERNRRWVIVLVPLQRLFYRVVVFTILIRSIVKAVEGTEAHWNSVRKRGDANAFHLRVVGETVEIDD